MEEINTQYPLTKWITEDLAETNWISLLRTPLGGVLKTVGYLSSIITAELTTGTLVHN